MIVVPIARGLVALIALSLVGCGKRSLQACAPALLGFRDSGASLVEIRTQIERALQFGDCRRIVILLQEINAIAVGSCGLFAASALLLDKWD